MFRDVGYDFVEDLEQPQALSLAETTHPLVVILDRLAHDFTLGLAGPLSRLLQLTDRPVIQSERDLEFCHTDTILPYYGLRESFLSSDPTGFLGTYESVPFAATTKLAVPVAASM